MTYLAHVEDAAPILALAVIILGAACLVWSRRVEGR